METFPRYWPFLSGIHWLPKRPMTRSFDVFFDQHLNERLSKQSTRRSFEALSCLLWRHCNVHRVVLWFVRRHNCNYLWIHIFIHYPRFAYNFPLKMLLWNTFFYTKYFIPTYSTDVVPPLSYHGSLSLSYGYWDDNLEAPFKLHVLI